MNKKYRPYNKPLVVVVVPPHLRLVLLPLLQVVLLRPLPMLLPLLPRLPHLLLQAAVQLLLQVVLLL